MERVQFKDIPVGEEFIDVNSGRRYHKISKNYGRYYDTPFGLGVAGMAGKGETEMFLPTEPVVRIPDQPPGAIDTSLEK